MFQAKFNDNGEIILSGRLDASEVDKARLMFEKITTSSTLNFSELDYISSAGLAVLISIQKRLSETGGGLRLTNMNKHIRDVFKYAGFDRIFIIE